MRKAKKELSEFIPDENGVFHEVFPTTVYHKSAQDRTEFEHWLMGEGGDLFSDYQNSLRKTYARICFDCKWFDQGKAQCYAGHIQRENLEECDDFESLRL
jgi:hypothetical protein